MKKEKNEQEQADRGKLETRETRMEGSREATQKICCKEKEINTQFQRGKLFNVESVKGRIVVENVRAKHVTEVSLQLAISLEKHPRADKVQQAGKNSR